MCELGFPETHAHTHSLTPARPPLPFSLHPTHAAAVVGDASAVSAEEIAAFRAVKAELADAVKRDGSSMWLKRGPATGLVNQGATCYMNSLLQALFATHEFRERLYQVECGARRCGGGAQGCAGMGR